MSRPQNESERSNEVFEAAATFRSSLRDAHSGMADGISRLSASVAGLETISALYPLERAIAAYELKLAARQSEYYLGGMLLSSLGLGESFKIHSRESKNEALNYLKALVAHFKNRQITGSVEVVGERLSALENGELGNIFAQYKALTDTHFTTYQSLASERSNAINQLSMAMQRVQLVIADSRSAIQDLRNAAAATILNMAAVTTANDRANSCVEEIAGIIEKAAPFGHLITDTQDSTALPAGVVAVLQVQLSEVQQIVEQLLAEKSQLIRQVNDRNASVNRAASTPVAPVITAQTRHTMTSGWQQATTAFVQATARTLSPAATASARSGAGTGLLSGFFGRGSELAIVPASAAAPRAPAKVAASSATLADSAAMLDVLVTGFSKR